jgi:flagellar basal-body rod protein FlgG
MDTAGHTITVPQNFTVAGDGTIVETGQRIAMVGWPPGGVTRLGESLLAAGGALSPATGNIRQNALERSNTDLGTGMTELIQFQRDFQMNARALSIQDSTIGDATALGRLR